MAGFSARFLLLIGTVSESVHEIGSSDISAIPRFATICSKRISPYQPANPLASSPQSPTLRLNVRSSSAVALRPLVGTRDRFLGCSIIVSLEQVKDQSVVTMYSMLRYSRSSEFEHTTLHSTVG